MLVNMIQLSIEEGEVATELFVKLKSDTAAKVLIKLSTLYPEILAKLFIKLMSKDSNEALNEAFKKLSPEKKDAIFIKIITLPQTELAAEVFNKFTLEITCKAISQSSSDIAAKLFSQLNLESRTKLLDMLPEKVIVDMINELPIEIAKDTFYALFYKLRITVITEALLNLSLEKRNKMLSYFEKSIETSTTPSPSPDQQITPFERFNQHFINKMMEAGGGFNPKNIGRRDVNHISQNNAANTLAKLSSKTKSEIKPENFFQLLIQEETEIAANILIKLSELYPKESEELIIKLTSKDSNKALENLSLEIIFKAISQSPPNIAVKLFFQLKLEFITKLLDMLPEKVIVDMINELPIETAIDTFCALFYKIRIEVATNAFFKLSLEKRNKMLSYFEKSIETLTTPYKQLTSFERFKQHFINEIIKTVEEFNPGSIERSEVNRILAQNLLKMSPNNAANTLYIMSSQTMNEIFIHHLQPYQSKQILKNIINLPQSKTIAQTTAQVLIKVQQNNIVDEILAQLPSKKADPVRNELCALKRQWKGSMETEQDESPAQSPSKENFFPKRIGKTPLQLNNPPLWWKDLMGIKDDVYTQEEKNNQQSKTKSTPSTQLQDLTIIEKVYSLLSKYLIQYSPM